MRLTVRVALLTFFVLAAAARADVGGVWSGTFTASDRCNSAPVTWSSPLTFAIVPVAGAPEVRGNAFFASVPLYDERCVAQGTLPVATPFGGRVSGETFTGTLVLRGRALVMSGTISGASMTLTLRNPDFTGAAALAQTATQIPPSPLSGFYAGRYDASETVERCSNLTAMRYSGPLTASIVQTGQFVTAIATVSEARRLVRDAGNVCSIQPDDDFTVQMSGQISGNTITGVLFNERGHLPFTATFGPNGISGSGSDAQGSFSFTLTRSVATTPLISLFAANPSTIAVGEEAALAWQTENATAVVIDHGIGRRPASGVIIVRPRATTEFRLTALGPGGTAEATTTVTLAPRPRVVVSAFPRGFIQRANEGGGTDRFTLSNVGEIATNVTLTPVGSFFTLDPMAFPLEPGENRTITITGLPQAAGPHIGGAAFAGDGVLAGGVPIRMLSVVPPSGLVRARAAQTRAEISSNAGQSASGTVRFLNDGEVPLQGVAVADVPWIVPDSGMITIPPGGAADVGFTVDSAKRADAEAPLGAMTGTISLVFPTGGASGRLTTNGTPPSSNVSVSLVYVVKPGVTPGAPPPLEAGELARFAPGLLNRGTAKGDLIVANTLTSAALDDISLFLQAGGASPQKTTISSLQPNSSVALPGVVGSVFGSGVQSASVQIRGADVSKVSAASLLANTTASGTFSASLPLFRSDRAAGSNAAIILSGVEQSSGTKTDLFVQETSGIASSFRADFLDANGSVISTLATQTIDAFGFAELMNAVPANAVAVRLVNTATSGALAAFGLVSNTSTGDGWAVTDPAAGSGLDEIFIVPVLSAGAGATTVVYTTNRGQEPVEVAVDVIGAKRGRRRAVNEVTDAAATLAALQTTSTSIFATSGWVRVTAPPASVAASARSVIAAYGTALPVIPLSDALEAGAMRRFAGVDDTASIDTNLLLVEASGQTAVVRVTLQFVFSGGSSLASSSARVSRDYSLGAEQALLISDLARTIIGASRDSFGDLRDMLVDVEVLSGSGRVAPFVHSIDTGSGDSVVRVE